MTLDKNKILWKPNPGAQTFVLTIGPEVFEILYGGARGGGKTDAGLAWLLRHVHNSKFRALVIRKNANDLQDWLDRAQGMYSSVGATVVGVPAEIRFPSGAVIRTGHLKDDQAYTKYQGHEYQRILIEELTQIPDEVSYIQLISSCRSTLTDIKSQVFCTTNPGGAGHTWVKKRFKTGIDTQRFWNKAFKIQGRVRIFVPAKIEDNPILIEKDPEYVKFLESLPEDLRKAWREGSWDDPEIEGAIYRREISIARTQNRISQVPFDAAAHVYTWWDLGYGDKTAIGFFQRRGTAWNMIDYYESSGQSLSHYAAVLDAKARSGYNYDRHFGPHDLDQHDIGSGLTRKETLEKLGYYLEVVPKLGLDEGIQAVRIRFSTLYIDEEACAGFIEAISNYRYAELKDGTPDIEGVAKSYQRKPVHDWTSHAADMLRYWAITPEFSPSIIRFSSRIQEVRANKVRQE